MFVRHQRVDRYVFDAYFRSSRIAKEWVEETKRKSPWFSEALLFDFFLAFYLKQPEVNEASDAASFHRWMIRSLLRQHFYQSIHPRTIASESASFKTASKALMWLVSSFEEEVQRRKKMDKILGVSDQSQQGQNADQQSSDPEQTDQLLERLTQKQQDQLRLVGYTLQQGKQMVEDKEESQSARPLAEEEVQLLRSRIIELQEEMKTNYIKRPKLLQKVKKLEAELMQRQKQVERLIKQEKSAIQRLEQELGDWLQQSLKKSLQTEEQDTSYLFALVEASQRFSNRRWGSDLGKLRRETYEKYLKWVEQLSKHPDLLHFLQEVGRNVHQFSMRKKKRKERRMPEEYDDLRQSGDLSHLLASEALLLADPDLETYFMVKALEQKLLTYDTIGWRDEPPSGPVICMLDSSHSMRGAKLRLAQIFVMTFAAISLLEKRDFMLMLFGTKGEVIERPLYYKKPDWMGFYELAQQAFGGGTNFDEPIKRGIQILHENPKFEAADFVMITDGIGEISSPVRQLLGQVAVDKQVKLHSLIMGTARQHLVQTYDLIGISHRVRFATSWESNDPQNSGLFLDVFAP
ncbi:hypothetical protein NW801_11030 [Brevibacillus laterosporus]|uniref:VWFA domain-containing protein n=1 Tax=Brevibacillus halotolerans TaxID=1507437 RepID=A0ABT4HX66_9BACL|nr:MULTISPECIES: VWA domain-containing protein [Brevibacillus]MCR8985573.1 hypothetical protein [Brevibacillus laterosporus]MCZ0831307.1 hypothetical protein [Brevibacillus halotolerans]